MIFSLAIYAPPYSSQASYTAYRFAQSLLQQGHKLYRVFFYCDAVYTATHLATSPSDEFDLHQAWQKLATKYQLDLVVCIAAALKRGITNPEEAERYSLPAANLAQEFTISGLGQLIEAAALSDRVVSFGY